MPTGQMRLKKMRGRVGWDKPDRMIYSTIFFCEYAWRMVNGLDAGLYWCIVCCAEWLHHFGAHIVCGKTNEFYILIGMSSLSLSDIRRTVKYYLLINCRIWTSKYGTDYRNAVGSDE